VPLLPAMSYDNSKRRWQVRRYRKYPRVEPAWENIFTGPVFLKRALGWIIWARCAAPRPPEELHLVNTQTGEIESIPVWRFPP